MKMISSVTGRLWVDKMTLVDKAHRIVSCAHSLDDMRI